MKNSEILLNAPVGAKFNILEDDGTVFDPADIIVRTENGYVFGGPNGDESHEYAEYFIPWVFDGFPEDFLVPVTTEEEAS